MRSLLSIKSIKNGSVEEMNCVFQICDVFIQMWFV